MKDLDYEVYQQLCVGCEYEKRCHEECECCEAYEDLFVTLAAEEYFKNKHRLETKKILVKKTATKRGYLLDYYCPNCKALIGKYPYCKYCGQALEVNNNE